MRLIPHLSKDSDASKKANKSWSMQKLNQQIENYKSFRKSEAYDELYKWVALQNFQNHWDIEAQDFRNMYNSSFTCKGGENLWANNHFFPKAVMLSFIEHDHERVREMFRNLFDETLPVSQRFDRFEYHCENLLAELQPLNPSMKNHFHSDKRMISTYLAFRFPDKYAIYKFTEFKVFNTVMENGDIPGSGEHERFFKNVRVLYNIISKDEELVQLHRNQLTDECYKGETLMLAQDFIFRTAKRFI
jgi:hypothetical protein